MRIIGYIEHPTLKITVFKMDMRITVKFENSQFEQAFKLQTMHALNHIEDVKKLVDEAFIKDVEENFKGLQNAKTRAMDRFIQFDPEDEFDNIV